MYIRPKKKGKHNYAILVECRRVRNRGRPRKKTKGISFASKPKEFIIEHLGRIIAPEKTGKKAKINGYGERPKEIITNLLTAELFRHNFVKNNYVFKYKETIVDLKNFAVYRYCSNKKTKPLVLQINEGFLCGYTLKNLLNFKPKEDEDSEKMELRFSKIYLEAGLTMNEGVTKLFSLLTEKQEEEQTEDYIKNIMPELAEIRDKNRDPFRDVNPR